MAVFSLPVALLCNAPAPVAVVASTSRHANLPRVRRRLNLREIYA